MKFFLKVFLRVGCCGLLVIGVQQSAKADPSEGGNQLLENHVADLEKDMSALTNRLEMLEHQVVQLMKGTGGGQQAGGGVPQMGLSPGLSMGLSQGASQAGVMEAGSPDSLVKEDPKVVAAYNSALDLLKASALEKALGAFQVFEKENPKSELRGLALYWMGLIYFMQKKYEPALQIFESTLTSYPQLSKKRDMFIKMAKAYQAQGNRVRACASLKTCLGEKAESLKSGGGLNAGASDDVTLQAKALYEDLACASDQSEGDEV